MGAKCGKLIKGLTQGLKNLRNQKESPIGYTGVQFSNELEIEESNQVSNYSQADNSRQEEAMTWSKDGLNLDPQKYLVWCSYKDNQIKVREIKGSSEYHFAGAKTRAMNYDGWTHVKEIPNTKLLVSLHHNLGRSSSMKVFDLSRTGQASSIYSLEEVSGATGYGDVSYNTRRNFLGAISLKDQIAYHLLSFSTNISDAKDMVKLTRKSKWPSGYSTHARNHITGLDFNPTGEYIALIGLDGRCLISNVNMNSYGLELQIGCTEDWFGRCRWSTNSGEALLYVKCNLKKLNLLDAEKETLSLKNPVDIDPTVWIDVCQNNGNLLATGGQNQNIKIFDKRESRIAKSFEKIHSDIVCCVRWNPNGDVLASSSWDKSAKLLDLKTGKVILTAAASNKAMSVCLI